MCGGAVWGLSCRLSTHLLDVISHEGAGVQKLRGQRNEDCSVYGITLCEIVACLWRLQDAGVTKAGCKLDYRKGGGIAP